jgi:hypothetical protein
MYLRRLSTLIACVATSIAIASDPVSPPGTPKPALKRTKIDDTWPDRATVAIPLADARKNALNLTRARDAAGSNWTLKP